MFLSPYGLGVASRDKRMELINQHTKKIMEGCKESAKEAGLKFQDETLEYIVTNRDLLELSPKHMIPTLYDYWVHEVEVLKEKGKYELYPANPYETVINTRPAISFYNDNNPDWLNVMIFYHVLAHIDFFQNNLFFRQTWDYDFTGKALSDKRLITKLRSEKGRWVDYVIEFARGVDNLVGYHQALSRINNPFGSGKLKRLDFYFDVFLQATKKVTISEYIKEIENYNKCIKSYGELGEKSFFTEVNQKYPEFEAIYHKNFQKKARYKIDPMQFIMEHSSFLNKEENVWMKAVLEVVQNTSMFFQPQIRTKIMNEGWASYWHEKLFLNDNRIKGHEIDFARVNALVTSMPRVGLNPYALGMRLFYHIEEMGDKGRFSYEFQRIDDSNKRNEFDLKTGKGKDLIFKVRENLNDFMFINNLLDQEFMTRYNLFVAGKRLNKEKMVWEYFVKSRKAAAYKKMLQDSLYHPPFIEISTEKSTDTNLYLVHHFEGKPLVQEYLFNTLMGIEYLWGGPVKLETNEFITVKAPKVQGLLAYYPIPGLDNIKESESRWNRVLYTMENRKITKENI